jgi:hypothetical protein
MISPAVIHKLYIGRSTQYAMCNILRYVHWASWHERTQTNFIELQLRTTSISTNKSGPYPRMTNLR